MRKVQVILPYGPSDQKGLAFNLVVDPDDPETVGRCIYVERRQTYRTKRGHIEKSPSGDTYYWIWRPGELTVWKTVRSERTAIRLVQQLLEEA